MNARADFVGRRSPGSDHVDLALVVFPDEREGEKLLCRARGKTGDDGAAEPARHGAQHGLAVVDARDDVERAGVDAVFGEEFLPGELRAGTALAEDERLAEQRVARFPGVEHGAVARRVGRDEHERVGGDAVVGKLARVQHRADEADVRFALQYGGVDGGAVAAAEQKAEIRVSR